MVNAILVSPESPRPGETFRVMVTGGKSIRKAKIEVTGPGGTLEGGKSRIGNGLPFWRIDEFKAGTEATQAGIGTLAGMTDAEKVQQYMSPYIQNVLDVNKAEALRDAQRELVGANLASARQGTYGGYRNALMQSEADRNLQTKLGNIQATGMQNAFDAAQKAQLAQAAGYGQLGSTMGALGTGQEAAAMDILKAKGAYGDLERAIQQQQLDAQYNDLMARQNQPLTNLETMSNLARGVPLTQTGMSQSTTTPPPSFASQLAGMGLTGLSLYNMFGKP
jgi:hypothetical protein